MKAKKRTSLSTELLADTRIPRNHWRLGADTFPGSRESLRLTRTYIGNHVLAYRNGAGLIFHGNQSSCKTFLAGYALRCLLSRGRTCFYLTLRELTDASMGGKDAGFNLLERLRNADFLCIDQIGHDPNGGEKTALKEAIKRRVAEMLPTLFCVDLPLSLSKSDNFASQYGDELHNYLADYNEPIECRMTDHRAHQMRERRFAGILAPA